MHVDSGFMGQHAFRDRSSETDLILHEADIFRRRSIPTTQILFGDPPARAQTSLRAMDEDTGCSYAAQVTREKIFASSCISMGLTK